MMPEPLRPACPDSDLSPLGEMDPDRFDRLLDIAGPQNRTELLTRLAQDLAQVRDRLAVAGPVADWADLRAQSHVLIALAGATGAVRLQHQSEDLNKAARDRRRGPVAQLVPLILAGIDRLIAHARQHLDGPAA
jgi:hypothetical protein